MSSLILSVVCVFFFRGSFACFHEDDTQTVTLSTGSTYYQECQCNETGYGIQHLKWLDKDNNIISRLGTDSNIYVEYQSDRINLHIPKISKTMSGTYKCITEFKGQQYIQNYKIEAYDPLYIYDSPEIQHLVEGKNSRIQCNARGETEPIINWEIDRGDPIEIMPSDKYVITPEGLIINNVTIDDAGKYKCTASVISTGEEVDRFIKVQVMTIPVIEKLNAIPEANVAEGETLSIECIANAMPHPGYIWTKISEVVESENSNGTWKQHLNIIIFDNITTYDSGTYECKASNYVGSATRQIEVNVLQQPKIIDFSNRTETEGTNITITCNATGRPEPNVTVSAIKRDEYEEGEYAVTIPSVSWTVDHTFQGLYVCNATNEMGSDTKEMYMTVLHKPYFHKLIQFEWGWDGKTVNLSCAHKSNPPAKILWSFQLATCWTSSILNNTLLANYCYFTDNLKSTMFVSKVMQGGTASDRLLSRECAEWWSNFVPITFYDISQTKELRNDIKTKDQVEINKKLLEMLSSAKNHYLPIIIDKNFSYGIYECVAKNGLGQTTKTVTLKEGFVPLQVTNASIIDITATSVLFSIEKPDEKNGPKVVGFTAEYDEAENYKVTNIHVNRTWAIDRPFKLEKLKPNTKYQVKFAAVNDVGAGAWSDTLDFMTLEKSVPEPPVWDVDYVEPLSGCDQVIKWKTPEDNGEPIDYYVLRYCTTSNESNEKLCVEKNVDLTTQVKLHELQCNTTYHLELMAHNSEGNSTIANISITTPAIETKSESILTAGIIIGIAVVVVVLCLVLLDIILYTWKKQGIIASCCYKKNKKKKNLDLNSRDKKGLLRDNREATDDSIKRPNKGHKEYEYNKTTGIITGKHSAV